MSPLRAEMPKFTSSTLTFGYSVAPAVEEVEEFRTYLEVGRLGERRLLHDAEVLRVEGLSTQAAVCRGGVAEEAKRVSVVGDVRRVDG